jgi:hypothetical protein
VNAKRMRGVIIFGWEYSFPDRTLQSPRFGECARAEGNCSAPLLLD